MYTEIIWLKNVKVNKETIFKLKKTNECRVLI